MRPLKRKGAHKGKSARKFKKHVRRTMAPNAVMAPMRGGWRL